MIRWRQNNIFIQIITIQYLKENLYNEVLLKFFFFYFDLNHKEIPNFGVLTRKKYFTANKILV